MTPQNPRPPGLSDPTTTTGRPKGWTRPWIAIGAGVALLLIFHACDSSTSVDGAESPTVPAASSPTARAATSTAKRIALTTSAVPASQTKFTPRVESITNWLDDYGKVGFGSGSTADQQADLKRLAQNYGDKTDRNSLLHSIPAGGLKVRAALNNAARRLAEGETALKDRQYTKSREFFAKATKALEEPRPRCGTTSMPLS